MSKRPALGKGLSALLENADTDITNGISQRNLGEKLVGSVAEIAVEKIEANPFQPRTEFESEALQELATSIKELGIIQPITVRKMGYDNYQLISGERRFKAAQIAGLTELPAFIRVANDQAMLEMALVENIQRENLDAIEIAISYKRLLEECDLTQDALSERIGKKRATISNYIRLLKLPAEIQMAIQKNAISMGHARALISIENEDKQLAICNQILEEGLSVRQAEELARGNTVQTKNNLSNREAKIKPAQQGLSFSQQKIQNELSKLLSAKVKINLDNKGKGKIVIPFKNEQEMERISELLNF